MDCAVEIQGDPVKDDVLANSPFVDGKPSNVIEVKPVDCENPQTDCNSVNINWVGKMPANPNKEHEKERLIQQEITCDIEGDVELNGFVSNRLDDGIHAKLLVDDLETGSLSSIGDDSPTFSTSKLVISNDVELSDDNNNNNNNNNNIEHLSDVSSTCEQNGTDADVSFQVPVVTVRGKSESVHLELEGKNSNELERSSKELESRRSKESIALSSMRNSMEIPGVPEIEETSFSTGLAIEDKEDYHLLQPVDDETSHKEEEDEEEEEEEEPTEHMNLMETRGEVSDDSMENEPEEVGEEADDDDASVVSEFRGSLGIDVLEIPWEVDIDRVVDIQLGADEWGTEIHQPEGGVRLEAWETKIFSISKEELSENWNTTINKISEDDELHAEWSTDIAEQFQNKELKVDWSTKFNKIEKADETKNKWTTIFRKIKEHISPEGEWSTTFNRMSLKTDAESDWTFNMAGKFTNLAQADDWNTRFTKIEGGSNAADPWPHTYRDMLLTCDDRESHWETKFIPISENTAEMNPWDTTFNQIAPPDDVEVWDTTFYPISGEKNIPEDWSTKFIDIEPHIEDENEWTITIEDIPDNFNVPADWSAVFYYIQNHEANLLWDTFFNKILPPDEELDRWEDAFNETDLTDIERETWETTFYGIANEGEDCDWTIETNLIECEE